MSLLQFSIAVLAAAIISIVSWRLKVLDLSGAIAAFLLGTIVFAVGGWSASILLMLFFISGSLLSKLPLQSAAVNSEVSRNWNQVFANGWLPALALLILYVKPALREEMTALFLGALATAAADTFATEFGIRFGKRAVNIATFEPLQSGLSGGVSLIGTIASILGALIIAIGFKLSSVLGELCQLAGVNWLLALILAGFVGALADSWMGATMQVKYQCEECQVITEEKIHCDCQSKKVRGISWIDNNIVNAISTGFGGLFYLWLLSILG